MAPRIQLLPLLGAGALTLAALTNCGSSTPDADAVIAGSHDLLASSDQALLLGPVPGEGIAQLPDVTINGDYLVKVRCIGTGSAAITINGQSSGSGDCSDGMSGRGDKANGQPVHITVDGSKNLYWVAAVFACTKTDTGVAC
jgi:hypothetical protein